MPRYHRLPTPISLVNETWVDAFFLAARRGDFDAAEHGPFHLFKVDVTELVLVQPAADALMIQSWRPGETPRRFERK